MSVTEDPAGRARLGPSQRQVSRSGGAASWSLPARSAARYWRRVRLSAVVRWHAARLDRELAAGIGPQPCEAHALRARTIIARRSRTSVARGLQRVLRSATDTAPGFTAAVRPHRREVLAARTVIETLERRLRAPEPVSARGMAILGGLLTDGTSPLYRPDEPGALGSQLRAAAAALEPASRWD
ncbi:MAG: hypothetical protein WAN22_31475 [Solirubrobacteraceae bacterium]